MRADIHVKRGIRTDAPYVSSMTAMVMMVMVMVMMVVAMASAVMVMMMSDHNLGGPGAGALCQTLIVGFQQRQGVRDRVEKVAIAGSLREFRPDRRRRLGSAHRGEGCRRSQQAG
jgi:hypothetical protein